MRPILLLVLLVPVAWAGSFSFIAIGDTPYSAEEETRLAGQVYPAIRDGEAPFVVHYGDLKSGGDVCSGELLASRRDDVLGLKPGKVFYTPGDNEWTDCDRDFLETRFSELERLDHLRGLFFKEPLVLPEEWGYARQPNFPENARWLYDGVLFVTVHMVSTNNGRREILMDDIDAALALVEARDQANRVWVDDAFQAAKKANAKAVVLVTQADVTSPDGSGPCTAANRMMCDAFQPFREQLKRVAAKFAKPVLLVHGDTNPYCWDKTFGGEKAANLWRLNGWGDFQAPADATVIAVDPENPDEPFSAKTLLEGRDPNPRCP